MNHLTRPLMVGIVAGVIASANALADKEAPVRFESGGATYEEVDAMNLRARDYSFKLVLAAKGSGAYLSDVDVTITSLPQREAVLQHRTEGPMLLAELPPGRYEVSGTFTDVLPGAPTTVKRTVVVPRNGLAQTVLYFDTGDGTGASR
jgi:hypothetical protein